MLARTYFPLLTVLISCTAKTGHPDVEPTGSPAPSSLVEPSAGAAVSSTAVGADAAQPPHVALEADDRPCSVISSNPGQALWTGIVDTDKAGKVVDRLLAPDMYNGWGIRTLSRHERRYNPIGYHLGTVWPHDNALIAAGCRRYGYDAAARRIFQGMLEAAMGFDHYRLPEVFAGFAREEYGVPVHYPVACHPQAWAAGSIPYLLETMLGLQPHAFEQRLDIVNPDLPALITWLEMRRVRVGQAVVDLRFERGVDGLVRTEVMNSQGPVEVVIQDQGKSGT